MAKVTYEEELLGLNMTPMIDIVFQLIVFFMLNLKFKAADYRIDTALPKDRGIQATPTIVQEIPSIKVILFRLNEDDRANAQTKIKIGNQEWFVPKGEWTGASAGDQSLQAKRDAVYNSLTDKIKGLFAGNKELKGEIEAPPPKGQAVPHADIMAVLDSFLAAGMTEVNFVGAASPLPKSKRPAGP